MKYMPEEEEAAKLSREEGFMHFDHIGYWEPSCRIVTKLQRAITDGR